MVKEELADVLSEFARTMVTDFPIQRILDHLVRRIVDIMPVTGAGVTLISETREPQYVAASNAVGLLLAVAGAPRLPALAGRPSVQPTTGSDGLRVVINESRTAL